MTAKTKNQLQGNQVVPFPITGHVIFDKGNIGELALAKLNERFKGVKNIEDTTEYQPNQPISLTNVPRVLSYNQILLKETKGRIHVASPIDMIRFWNCIPEKLSTYADSNSITIYPKEGLNEDLRQVVLKILGIQNPKVPLIVSGLDIEKADNQYGFTFKGTDFIQASEEPLLTKDHKYQIVSYDSKTGKLVKSKTGVQIFLPNNQSGLRRTCRDRFVGLNFRVVDLLYSNSDGRVPFVQDLQGSEKNLEEFVRVLGAETEIKARK